MEELRRSGASSRARVLFIVVWWGMSVGKSVGFVVSRTKLVVYIRPFPSVVVGVSHLFGACGVLCAKLNCRTRDLRYSLYLCSLEL